MARDSAAELRNQVSGNRSIWQLLVLLSMVAAMILLTVNTEVLLLPILLSVTLYFILNPLVSLIERFGQSRTFGAILATVGFFVPAVVVLSLVTSSLYRDLAEFETAIPGYVTYAQERLLALEGQLVDRFAWIPTRGVSAWVVQLVKDQSSSFLSSSPGILSSILWTTVLVPIVTFFLLRDVVTIRNIFLSITPNRYFEKTFSLAYQIERKIGAFIVAKLAEALLVGICTLIGLLSLNFPYAVLLSVAAGLTNIIPYFGPVLGFFPIIAIPFFVPAHQELLVPVVVLALAVNIVDILIIFPLLVSRVIDLHPVLVLFSVIIGGSIGGPIGLLVAIPVAAIGKLIFFELMGIGPKGVRH